MGGYAGMIGRYALHMGDWVFDYVKDRQPKEYYENYMVDLEFIKRDDDHPHSDDDYRDDIQIPLLKLGKLTKLKKYYRFEPDFSLQRLLWEEIERRDLVVEGYIGIYNYYVNENGENIFKYYYLTSEIGEEPIRLQSPTEGVDILHRVRNFEENKWCVEMGLEFFSEIRT